MKTTPRLSGPVLAFGIVCFAICALVGWFALKQRKHSAVDDASQAEIAAVAPAETSSETETNLTEPAPAYDLSQGVPPVIPVSLVPYLIDAENSHWNKSDTYLAMPRGTQSLAGIEFLLEGVIQLQSTSTKNDGRTFRENVAIPLFVTNSTETGAEVIPLGSNVASIHLLGATRYLGEGEVPVANILWRYTDGVTRTTSIIFENHVRDWVRNPYETPDYLPSPHSKAAWNTPLPKQAGRYLRLYRFSYNNPHPTKVVRELALASTMQSPNLVVVGLTLDPLKLGVRPDDSANLEPRDAFPASQVFIMVQTEEGSPIPDVLVRANIQQISGKLPTRYERSAKTDASGIATIPYPPAADLESLEVIASHDDFGSRQMTWSPPTGDMIPASYTLKLKGGLTISGSVVDESDNPIPDARIYLSRYWTGSDERKQKGEQASFQSQTRLTDSAGRWQAKGLPPELLDRISLRASHPDFVETGTTVGSNAADEAKLRDGMHKFVLKRGLIVRGKVTDESDNPIEGAQVWAGKVNYGGTQDTKTDAKGEFSFRNLKEGEIQFSVLAKGQKPETKSITVKSGMAEIVFKLGKGSVIRGVVRNDAGEAISDVRISLESRTGGVSDDFRFEMKTDNDGRFEWDGAPDEPRRFYIGKQGYEQKRGVTLKVAEENVVTLRKGRKVQGWVVDAETEKPITKFRVGVGNKYSRHPDGDRISINYPGMKEFSDPNGVFTLDVDEEQINGIKAVADEYAEKLENLPAAEDGVVKVTLRLKPSPALRGILVDSQGSPVASGTVALTEGGQFGSSAMLRNGRLSASSSDTKVVTTDASGNFTLPSPPESGGAVVGSAAVGFGSASVDQVRSSGRLMLRDFGRIEGTIKIAGVPTPGKEFTFNIANIGVSYQSDGFAKSDEQGKFTFEKLPAGEGSVIRLIKTSERSWSHSHTTSVTIEPGQTTKVSFGEDGAVIKGRAHLETQPAEVEQLKLEGRLQTKMAPMPQFSTPEESQAYFKSDEYKQRMKQMKYYTLNVEADGSFSTDSIPPGEYTLNVSANKVQKDMYRYVPPVATGSTTVNVPENSTPYSPVFVPDIFLKPVQKP